MSQHIINCPKCKKQHEVDAFRSGGIANALFTVGNPNCTFNTEDKQEINRLLGIEEMHKQRIRTYEMPRKY